MIVDACRAALAHFIQEYVYEPGDCSRIVLSETDPAGAGNAYFSSTLPCVVLKGRAGSALLWPLRNRKCADGAIFLFRQESCELHIVELKSSLDHAAWTKVMDQFRGMHLSAMAVGRILGIPSFSSVTCYVGYKKSCLAANDSASLALMKGLVGEPNPYGGQEEWILSRLRLADHTLAKLKKGQRDGANDVDFGALGHEA